MGCGTSLSDGVAAGRPAPAAGPADERRQVTILFADLSGYTAVAEQLDPEVVKGVVSRILRRLSDEVDAHGGTVDKFIGDNVMALFGAPVAHEDDAVRAVRAGLGMQAAMDDVNADLERTHGVRFGLRVGINTGDVLYGTIGESSTVTGDAVNVAARLQAAGAIGTVTVGERTMRASRHAVTFAPVAPLELKGKSEPVPAHEAIALLQPHAIRRSATESPLVGRRTELSLVLEAQRRAESESRAQLLTIIGPAGVGKSRLLQETRRILAERDAPPTLHEGRCPAYGSGVFWPVAEVLRAEAALGEEDGAEDVARKLRERLDVLLERGGQHDAEARQRAVALIAHVLGYETVPTGPLESEDPQRVRDGFFAAVRSVVEAMAARCPVVLAFEDIHWADDSMLDLIGHLARYVRGPVLILCLAREDLIERRERWGTARRTERVHFLDPLAPDEAAELVAALLPADHAALAAGVAERAEGNPLFAEEMARSVAEEGAAPDRLPDTIQAVLAARLDSLEPVERRVVQHAAVVGRTFSLEVLEPIAREESVDLDEVLAVLEDKDILVQERPSGVLGGPVELGFRHVLIRDVAYESLPKALRAAKHIEVARWAEERAGDRSEELAEVVGAHYLEAVEYRAQLGERPDREVDAAVCLWAAMAGRRAWRLWQQSEASRWFGAALKSGERSGLPDADLAELTELHATTLDGIAAYDKVVEAYRTALERYETLGRELDAGRMDAMAGASLFNAGDDENAMECMERAIRRLEGFGDSEDLITALEMLGNARRRRGRLHLAEPLLRKAADMGSRMGASAPLSQAYLA
ncbi:MAG: AAA family ATPase, partial [Solirubrobacterales bacterium]|nr:AAA family ATPase [Solirubrobacterales bacterium]